MNEIELKSRAQRIADRLNALGFTKDGKPMVIDQAYELVAAGEGLRNQHVLRVLAKKATGLDAAVSTFAQGVYAAGYKPGVHVPPLVLPRLPDDKLIDALLVSYGPHMDEVEVSFAFEQWCLLMDELAKRASVEPITCESESEAERSWTDIVNRLRMDDREEILHLEGFIRQVGLMGELAKYGARVEAEQTGNTSGAQALEATYPVSHRTAPKVVAVSAADNEALIAFLQRIGYEVKESELHRPFWECEGVEVGSDDFETEAEAWDDAYVNALETAAKALNTSVEMLMAMPDSERLRAMERFNPNTLAKMLELLQRSKFEFKVGKKKTVQWRFVHDVFSSSLAPSFERAIAEAWQYAKKKLDLSEALFDAAPFEAQLVMLESALTGESKVVELDCVSEDERHRALAQEAYENYQFPTEVVEASGWESWSGSGLFRRSVFLATTDGEDTRKVIFEVKVSGEAVKASVSNS